MAMPGGVTTPLADKIVIKQIQRVNWPKLDIKYNSFLSEHVLAHAFSGKAFSTLELAVSAMVHLNHEQPKSCNGVTRDGRGYFTLRRSCVALSSPDGMDTSWLLASADASISESDLMETPDFLVFEGMYIPGYPIAPTYGFPRAYTTLTAAIGFCLEHPDMCTGVTFNPTVGPGCYSVRTSGIVVASAAGEKSWMHKGAVKSCVYLHSQRQAAGNKNKKARFEWIDKADFESVRPKDTFDDPQS